MAAPTERTNLELVLDCIEQAFKGISHAAGYRTDGILVDRDKDPRYIRQDKAEAYRQKNAAITITLGKRAQDPQVTAGRVRWKQHFTLLGLRTMTQDDDKANRPLDGLVADMQDDLFRALRKDMQFKAAATALGLPNPPHVTHLTISEFDNDEGANFPDAHFVGYARHQGCQAQGGTPMSITLDSLLALAPNRENSVVVNRHLAAFAGSLEAGMLLGQLLYWSPRAKINGGWIAKKDADWAKELWLSKYAVRVAAERLLKMGVVQIQVRKFAGAPTAHYRLVPDKLMAAWEQYLAPRLFDSERSESIDGNAESDKSKEMSKSANENADSSNSYTETTTETTSTKTTSSPAPAPRGKKEPTDTTRFKLHFMAGWKRRYGADYYWLGGQDGKNAQRILAAFGGDLGRAKAAADAFLASDDAFYVKGGHKLGLLFSNINTYLGQKEATLDDQLLVGGKQWKGVDLSDEDLIALGILTPDQVKPNGEAA